MMFQRGVSIAFVTNGPLRCFVEEVGGFGYRGFFGVKRVFSSGTL